jgi:hypothetical protein
VEFLYSLRLILVFFWLFFVVIPPARENIDSCYLEKTMSH